MTPAGQVEAVATYGHRMTSRLVAIAAILAACSSAEPLRACTPGAAVPCTCPGGGSGGQVCGTDGQSYGACVCADAGAPADVPGVDVVTLDALAADAPPADRIEADEPLSDARDAPADTAPSCASCPEVPGAITTCEGGACGWICRPGRNNCDANRENGCEVDTTSDPMNCGGCRVTCPPPPPGMIATCSTGVCGAGPLACAAPFANCDGDVANGCEVDTRTGVAAGSSVANCGACGTACSFANASPQCLAGVCVLGACADGFANCDGDSRSGCETNLSTSTNNCGRCGRACSYPNASPVCGSGSCSMGACNAGWCDRNHSTADGCEYRGVCV